MKIITAKLFMSKETLDLLAKDINAKESYTVFSNKEEGTIEVEAKLSVPEEFRITEDLLADIVSGLLPALSEREQEAKIETVKIHLRSIGASL